MNGERTFSLTKKRYFDLFLYSFKQILSLKVFVLLFVTLILPIAFGHSNVTSYVFFFEGILSFVFSILFFQVVSMPADYRISSFEYKAATSGYTMFIFRTISLFSISAFFYFIVLLVYRLAYPYIDIYAPYAGIYGDVLITFTHIGVVKVFISFFFSLLFLTAVYSLISLLTRQNFIALGALILYQLTCMVYTIPLNHMTIFYAGDAWFAQKVLLAVIGLTIYFAIYLIYRCRKQ